MTRGAIANRKACEAKPITLPAQRGQSARIADPTEINAGENHYGAAAKLSTPLMGDVTPPMLITTGCSPVGTVAGIVRLI